MAYGRRICASCGSKRSVEEHHLVPQSLGGARLPSVYLCSGCHGLVHGLRRSLDHCELTRAGLAAAKARGVKLGNPQLIAGSREMTVAANQVRAGFAAGHATDVHPFIAAAKAAGALSLRQIAAALTARGVRTPMGSERWTATQVSRVLARLSAEKDPA